MSAASDHDEHESDDERAPEGAQSQRLDKWLWYCRVVKTRSLAARLVSEGKVRLNRVRVDKPRQAVKPGDVLTVAVHERVRVLKVVAPGVRRGPAVEARALFEEIAEPGLRPATPNAAPPGQRERGQGRPTKRERREIDRLKDDGS
jgi:ribosome-associated heat shock protein Hsp15